MSGQNTAGPMKVRRFHIISISVRHAAGDHAYRLRESFNADLESACRRHNDFASARIGGVRCSVLRDGSTGIRYSLEESLEVIRASDFEATHMQKLRAIESAQEAAGAQSTHPQEARS